MLHTERVDLEKFVEGVRQLCEAMQLALSGIDEVARHPEIVRMINITVGDCLGIVELLQHGERLQ